MPLVTPPFPPVNASSAQIQSNQLFRIANNILGTSGVLDASSAILYAGQIRGASSAILTIMSQCQLGMQVSS